MKTQTDIDNIELRSEKVRHVIGQVPPALVRTGTMVITLVVIALVIASYTIRYPITIEARGNVTDNGFVGLLVPYKYLYLFDEPRTALVTLEGQNEDAPAVPCPIVSHNDELLVVGGGHYFVASAYPRPLGTKTQHSMNVSARIVVSDKTLWQLIIGR